MLPDSSTNLIIATVPSKHKRRSQLSKATNLLVKIAFSRFCHSEFIYVTGSVYLT